MGATNLRFFLTAMKVIGRELPADQALKAHRLLSIAGLQGVVTRMPVDTGRARANVQVANGTPVLDVLDATDKSGQRTINKGMRTIEKARPFEATYITNNLVYGPPLEEGSSSQAPLGMFAVTAAELMTIRVDQLEEFKEPA